MRAAFLFVGVGGIEPPLHAPHACGLPLPHTPLDGYFRGDSYSSNFTHRS